MIRVQQSIALPGAPHVAFTMSLDPNAMTQGDQLRTLQSGAAYEGDVVMFFLETLKPGDVVIDGGAHVGYFTLIASRIVGETGRVVTFEPNRRNFAHVLEHLGMNGVANVIPVPAALGREPGVATFFENLDNDGGHALWQVGEHPYNQRSRAQGNPGVLTPITTIDAVRAMYALPTPTLIKLDVEGNEVAALEGAVATMGAAPVPYLMLEYNFFALEKMGTPRTAVRDLLAQKGYTAYYHIDGTLQFAQIPDSIWVNPPMHVINVLAVHRTARNPFGPATQG